MSSILDRARDHAHDYLRTVNDRHVGPRASREELMSAFDVPLTENGEAEEQVLDVLASQAERGIIATGSPRYFGFVIGGTIPVSLGADWLVSTWDQNPGLYATSPVSSVVEDVARGWLLDLLDLPRDASVGFVTGGQMANFTCLAAARHGVLRRAGWNVEEEGLYGAPRVNLVASAESHITIDVSMRYLGFGTRALQRVDTDAQGRMIASELRRVLENLNGPTIVCAQAGNVNTGSFDPIGELADIAHEHDAWLHVDGAFGLWARASRDRAFLMEGGDRADSWGTDAHKWLNVPYDCGLAIVKHSAAHRAAMTTAAAYLQQTGGVERDPFDWAPEFSRRARGTPVYAALRTLGRRGVEELVDRCCLRARQFAELLSKDPRVKILNDVVLNQVLVRFRDDDATTRATITNVQKDGTCWLGGTTWHGLAAMRISVSNWQTGEEDVERSVAAILSCV